MNIYKTNLFPYIIGNSLVGKTITMTMKTVKTEQIATRNNKSEEKIVLYFDKSEKGLILNKTNCKIIASLYGAETNDWAGKQVTLYTEEVKAFGETHNAIRIAPAIPVETKPAKKGGKAEPVSDEPLFPLDEAETQTSYATEGEAA